MKKEAALITTGLTGLILGILGVVGVSLSEGDTALLTQLLAFVVPLILNFAAGAVTRSRVYSEARVERERGWRNTSS